MFLSNLKGGGDGALPRLKVRTRAQPYEYEIRIGRGIISHVGDVARNCLGKPAARMAIISNRKVFSLYGGDVVRSLQRSGFAVSQFLIGDGEQYKSVSTLDTVLRFLYKAGLERGDGIVSLGGGVVGDVAGFAAGIYLRGVSFIQVPTSLLAQVDSSVGGKTGVNLPGGKNLVGSFHQPRAVIADVQTLTTLPPRELVAGWSECVKQGAVSSRKLFTETTDCLRKSRREGLISSRLEQLIASHCAFKASIVVADEREDPGRTDRRSRRILNFGHTIAHALETVTNYQRFRHGEAVGKGMLVAGELSKNLGLLAQTELELLREAVSLCGPLPSTQDLDERAVVSAIAHDKKRTAGQVKWVLLERIGKPRIVDGKEIGQTLLRKSVREVFQRR